MIRNGLFLILVAACAVNGQQEGPAFAAASVKQNHSASNGMGGMIGFKQGGSVSMRNVPARMLIEMAYGLADYQLSSSPAWTTSAGYDVEAKPEQPVSEDVAKLMLQHMLAERFHLRVHHEDSSVNGFRLVVDKGGSKLKPSDAC